ncbi:MAG TPA: helix-turn-helix transcriptional regulator [Microvirga sp.]|nr:helix-turn-helix transcriptional regulator [Microvirga sp.]
MVGTRLRLRRQFLGMSQGDLGAALGVSFQQVQDYEQGIHRLGANRLVRAAEVLGVPVSYFFQEQREFETPAANAGFLDVALGEHDALQLVMAFATISNKDVRHRLLQLVQAVAATEEGSDAS